MIFEEEHYQVPSFGQSATIPARGLPVIPRDIRTLRKYARKGVLLRKTRDHVRRLASIGELKRAAKGVEDLMYHWKPAFRETRRTVGEMIRTPKLPAKAVYDYFDKEWAWRYDVHHGAAMMLTPRAAAPW